MKFEKEQIGIIEFEAEHKGLSNSDLLERIYTENDVISKLKKSDKFFVYELTHDEKPLFTFMYNRGYMKGKVFCLLLTHKNDESGWHIQVSKPFVKEGEEWVVGNFRTKAREEEITKFIESGELWK